MNLFDMALYVETNFQISFHVKRFEAVGFFDNFCPSVYPADEKSQFRSTWKRKTGKKVSKSSPMHAISAETFNEHARKKA